MNYTTRGFPSSSAGKESTCNAGDPSLIPGWGRFLGEGIGYPHQYSWVSMVTQTVKNPPAIPKTWVQSLGWEDPQKEEMATHSRVLAWRIPWTKEAGGLHTVHGVTESQTCLSDEAQRWTPHCVHTLWFCQGGYPLALPSLSLLSHYYAWLQQPQLAWTYRVPPHPHRSRKPH